MRWPRGRTRLLDRNQDGTLGRNDMGQVSGRNRRPKAAFLSAFPCLASSSAAKTSLWPSIAAMKCWLSNSCSSGSPRPHTPGLMLPGALHRQESLYVWLLAGQFSIYSVATGTVGGSIPRAARHLVDVLLEAVSDCQAWTWWASCSSGRSVRRSDQVRAARIQLEP